MQGAGKDGVMTILEKLLLEVKFELAGAEAGGSNPVESVEITEDFVQGKAPPSFRHVNRDAGSSSGSASSKSLPDLDRRFQGSVRFTEFEEKVVEELALSL